MARIYADATLDLELAHLDAEAMEDERREERPYNSAARGIVFALVLVLPIWGSLALWLVR